MTRDTRRDRVWKTVLDLATTGVDRDHPEWRFEGELGPDGVLKQDVLTRVEAGDRTVHDVLKTMVSYGLLDEETKRTAVAAPETNQEYQHQRATVYTLAAAAPIAGAAEADTQTPADGETADADPGVATDETDSAAAEVVATRADGTEVTLDVERGQPDAADRVADPDGDTRTDVDLPRASSPDELAEWLPDVGEHRAHNLWIAGVSGFDDLYRASVDDLTDVSGVGKTTAERLKVVTAGYILDERGLTEEDLYAKDLGSIEDMFNMERETVERLVSK
jgi:DNA uptake protein ComE-like DNA-binding protein